jgi:hypothetical protein
MRARSVEVWTKWRGLVSEQELSGQSVSVFCRERGLCAPHMFSWKKRLRQPAPEGFLEVQVLDAIAPSQSEAPSGKSIEVRLGAHRSLVVEPGFDASHLRALLAVLESVS